MERRSALAALGTAAMGITTAMADARDHENEMMPAGAPLSRMHLYLCAFHIAKKDPKIIVEAHHFCMPFNEEVHQCLIFDNIGKSARILGIEYIISDRLYRNLPDSEKKYFHPHAYEVTSGLLVAPAMKPADEDKLMSGIVTSWGKTWHTWPDPSSSLPLGEPLLMWSANKDGQIGDALLAERDRALKISTRAIRKRRASIGPVPRIEPPKSLDELGRQWTNQGPDEPPRR